MAQRVARGNILQKDRFIKYRRGNIRILDVAGLKEAACECFGTVKDHYFLHKNARGSSPIGSPLTGR